VTQALARGGLRQWILVAGEAERQAATALLTAARARHVEAVTAEDLAERHRRSLARILGTDGPDPDGSGRPTAIVAAG